MCWNKCLIENVIVPTYILVLNYLKAALFTKSISKKPWGQLDKFHSAFPCMKDIKDDVWRHTAKSLYSIVANSNCCVFPIVRRDYENLEVESVEQEENAQNVQPPKAETAESSIFILKAEHLEIKWVSMVSGEFPAYFDEIKYQLKDDLIQQNYYYTHGQSYLEIMQISSKKSEFLSGILKDLGMKIIESPLWIYKSMNDAGTNVQKVSPKEVLQFLKSYKTEKMEKCKIEKVNVHASKTRFRSSNGVCHILEYCLRDKTLTDLDFENVPLLLSESGEVREFEETNKIFVTSVKDLLPLSTELIAHSLQYSMLQKTVFQKFVKKMLIQDFALLIDNNVPTLFR